MLGAASSSIIRPRLSISELVRKTALGSPSKVALRFLTDGETVKSLTFGELIARAERVARHLQATGAGGERVLLLLPPGPDYVVSLLGCLLAGVTCVPAYPPRFNRPMMRLIKIVEDAQAKFALSSDAIVRNVQRRNNGFPQLACLRWLSIEQIDSGAALLEVKTESSLDAPAIIQYTSGSTSDPKGVVLSNYGLSQHCLELALSVGTDENDRWLSWLPPYHDMGLIGAILTPLCIGVEITLMTPTSFLQRPIRWLEAISRWGATVSGGPNFAYELCARRATQEQCRGLDLSKWRYACCGSERVRPETLDNFGKRFQASGFRASAFVPCYGLAEAILAVTMRPADKAPRAVSFDAGALGEGRVLPARPGMPEVRLVSSGTPIGSRDVVIVDADTCKPQPKDIPGEIWAGGGSLAEGYWNRPELTHATFGAKLSSRGGSYLRTGDIGFLYEGELFVTGRVKDLIILGGINHYPEDLEASVAACHLNDLISGTAAFSIERESEEQLIIVQEIAPALANRAKSIEATIREGVAASNNVFVSDVVLVPPGSVPRTSSGKVQRSACRTLYTEGSLRRLRQDETAVAASSGDQSLEFESQIAAIMAELLGLASIGPNDDFFRLGGHSLLVTQLASRLRESHGIEIPLVKLFESPTARQLALCLSDAPRTHCPAPSERIERIGWLPLSSSQERMWLLHELDRESAAYNVAGAIRIEGSLDIEAFTRAFGEVMDRHEILRSNYATVDGAPKLKIRDPAAFPVRLIDISSAVSSEVAATSGASTLAASPFDIEHDLLVRLELYRLGPKCHIAAVSMHHLVTDAWSMGVILSELLRCYDCLIQGQPLPPSGHALGYIDLASWQRKNLSAEKLEQDLIFWLTELKGAKPIELPCDRPRTNRQSSRGALVQLKLSDELVHSLRDLAATHHATLFMLMLAAFEVALYRHSGQPDIVVGVPVADRTHSALESVVGTLVNTLALRVSVNPEQTFLQLLEQVSRTAIQCYMHQELPFDHVVSELGIERRPGLSPLVQVMFDFQNTPMPIGNSGALTLRPIPIARGAAQFDLSLMMLDTELGQTAGFEYSTDLFDEPTIQRFAEHYASILEAVLLDPNQRIDRIDLMSSDERQEVMRHSRNARRHDLSDGNFLTRFAANVSAQPDSTAVVDSTEVVSYRELRVRVDVLRLQLEAFGIGVGARVGLFLDRGAHLIVAMLAVLEAGAAYVPLDPQHPPDRVRHVLDDCLPEAIITRRALRSAVPTTNNRTRIICVDAQESPVDVALGPLEISVQSTRPAYVLYTSGSTGNPKGVEVSIGALDNFLRSMLDRPGIVPEDILLAVTTVAFDIAGLELLLPIVAGASVVIAADSTLGNGQALAQKIAEVRPTLIQATPSTWKMLLEAGFTGADNLRILCGGEGLVPDLASRLLARAKSVWNMYGPTETTIWSTVHEVSANQAPVPIGTPIDDTCVYVLDGQGELCPIGVPGEIFIGGAGVANGYLNKPELTAERFVSDPFCSLPGARMYRTGDLGRLRRDGCFEHWGRLDHQIKLRGFRIEPGEIETAIKQETGLSDVLVIARPYRVSDERLVAYYVRDKHSSLEPPALREKLRRRLPEYMLPTAFVGVPAFPQTPNGKVDRTKLPAPGLLDMSVAPVFVLPRDELERKVALIWCELLELPEVGIHEDFFLLGGHSLLAVQLIARIELETGVAVPLAALFEAPTIESLAKRIGTIRAETSAERTGSTDLQGIEVNHNQVLRNEWHEHLVLIHQGGNKRPLYCVHGAGGHVLNFALLAAKIGVSRAIYGLQARGVDGKQRPFERLQDAAKAYVREIERVQPSGPYLLAGYCYGGLIALEMAKILQSRGQQVALVALINTYYPGIFVRINRVRRFAERLWHSKFRFFVKWLPAFYWRMKVQWAKAVRLAYHRVLGHSVPITLRDYWLTNAAMQTLVNYRPEPYRGNVTVFRASGDEQAASAGPDLGWHRGVLGELSIYEVTGNHLEIMDEPHVSKLCDTLETVLVATEQSDVGGWPGSGK